MAITYNTCTGQSLWENLWSDELYAEIEKCLGKKSSMLEFLYLGTEFMQSYFLERAIMSGSFFVHQPTNDLENDSTADPCALELIKQLNGLPLALATAGAYLGQVSTSLKDSLRYYRTARLKLQETSPDLLSYEDRALYSTWNLPLEHIQNQNKVAGSLLRLWGFFENQDLWFQLLVAGSNGNPDWFSTQDWFPTMINDELNFNKVARLLCDHALIEPIKDSNGSCVHAWALHVLNAEKSISMAKSALTCVGSGMPTEGVGEYLAIERWLLPHAHRCLDSIVCGVELESQNNQSIRDNIHNMGLSFCSSKQNRGSRDHV